MKRSIYLTSICLLVIFFAGHVFGPGDLPAVSAADPPVLAAFETPVVREIAPPLMAKPGKLLFEDDFSRPDMKPKWDVGKGFWSVKDGVVSAAENPDDHHPAYAYITPNIDFKDAVAQFLFHFDGNKNVQLNMRDSRYKGSHAGHIIRVQIEPKWVELADWKTGVMKNENYEKTSDPKADPDDKRAIREKIKDKSAGFKVSIDTAEWHAARVEVVGDEMLLTLDGKPVGYLKSEGVAHETKNMLGITVGGKTGEIKNVKFWDATAAQDWGNTRATVLETLGK